MSKLNFIRTDAFRQKWNESGLTEADYTDLKTYIVGYFSNRPDNGHGKMFPGDIIQGTKGAYKLRYSSDSSNAGKSGSNRVIYCVITNSTLAFLDVYPKSKQESLSDKEKKLISKIIGVLKGKE